MKKVHKTSLDFLKERGYKVTGARRKILDILKNNHKPFSIKDIQEKVKNIDPVTIYRNLEQFAKLGIVNKLSFGGERAYFEYSEKHHHHVVCTNCGRVEELSGCSVSTELPSMKKPKSFSKISHHSLEFFGLCISCDNK